MNGIITHKEDINSKTVNWKISIVMMKKKQKTDSCKAEINFISYDSNPGKHIIKSQYIYKEETVHIVSSLEKRGWGKKKYVYMYVCIYIHILLVLGTSIRNTLILILIFI